MQLLTFQRVQAPDKDGLLGMILLKTLFGCFLNVISKITYGLCVSGWAYWLSPFSWL